MKFKKGAIPNGKYRQVQLKANDLGNVKEAQYFHYRVTIPHLEESFVIRELALFESEPQEEIVIRIPG